MSTTPAAATGAVSSAAALTAAALAQKSLQDRATPKAAEPAQAPAPEAAVLRTGEVVTSSLNGLTGGKTYYHRIAGARTVMPDGREIVFAGGVFATAESDIIAELDKVANRATSQIFTRREGLETVVATETRAAQEAGDTVGDNKNV